MPQISRSEFERVPLRVHTFMSGVPLHDAWCVDLPKPREGMTLDAFLRHCGESFFKPSPVVRALFRLRFFLGSLFGWDSGPPSRSTAESFADRLTLEDRARSIRPPSNDDGLFDIVYRFENEQLDEVTNATVHAAALYALVESEAQYRFYFAVYVRNVSQLTPVYMTLIDPFRRLIVYPSILRGVRSNWDRFTTAS